MIYTIGEKEDIKCRSRNWQMIAGATLTSRLVSCVPHLMVNVTIMTVKVVQAIFKG
jgi:hypothetical protein